MSLPDAGIHELGFKVFANRVSQNAMTRGHYTISSPNGRVNSRYFKVIQFAVMMRALRAKWQFPSVGMAGVHAKTTKGQT